MQTVESRSIGSRQAMLKLILLTAAFASFLLSVYLYFVADDKTGRSLCRDLGSVHPVVGRAAPRRQEECPMNQTVLFEIGAVIFVAVSTAVFLYGLTIFRDWQDRDEAGTNLTIPAGDERLTTGAPGNAWPSTAA